ncbi:MAG TPA: TRAP transporter small permease [Hyphomicrobiaceae bacterium]|nr:TRAP transporter small permease [Hyphomicrobiaceae bacterium]
MTETTEPTAARSLWRKATALYARLLDFFLVIGVAVLVLPVTLQVVSRYVSWLPHFIWTEEMARFLFVWTIMIGAMVGVRESQHFEVDLWPRLSRRGEALVKIIAKLGVLVFALAFVWGGYQFTAFAWNRISELAELPLWLIHVAWPVAGATWVLFLGEQFWDELTIVLGRRA